MAEKGPKKLGSIIIIPTYNEKDNIGELVKQILSLKLGFSILLIDDNSPDGTGEVLDELAKKFSQINVIHRPAKKGLGTAYIQGFNYSIEKGFENIITMDADFSHDPKYLSNFLEKINDYDAVIGSRYLQGVSVVNWPISRILLSIFANNYVRFITGLPFSDCTSGFACFKRRALESVNLTKIVSQGYSFLVEIKYHIFVSRFRVTEIPIIFVERRGGKTKISFKVMLESCLSPWKLRYENLVQRLKK